MSIIKEEISPEAAAAIVTVLRRRAALSRGQVARRLKVSPAVVYNLETGKTRIRLSAFFAYLRMAKLDPTAVLGRHVFSIKAFSEDPSELFASYRGRLRWSQRQLGEALGYKGASIIHHFEKGIREPDLVDFLRLMALARDNVHGFVLEITQDESLADRFPKGYETVQADWCEYWSRFYFSAIRQIMRTDTYRALQRYEPGYFARILGITLEEERQALEVLKKFGLVRWEKAKPVVDPKAQIIVPKIPREDRDRLKWEWIEFGKARYMADTPQGEPQSSILTIDTLPVSAALYERIVKRIRDLQDEFHNLPQRETDGFVQLGWLAAYVRVPSSSAR